DGHRLDRALVSSPDLARVRGLVGQRGVGVQRLLERYVRSGSGLQRSRDTFESHARGASCKLGRPCAIATLPQAQAVAKVIAHAAQSSRDPYVVFAERGPV